MVGGAWEGQLVGGGGWSLGGVGWIEGESLGGASGPDGRCEPESGGVDGEWSLEVQLSLIPHSEQLVHGQAMVFRYTV